MDKICYLSFSHISDNLIPTLINFPKMFYTQVIVQAPLAVDSFFFLRYFSFCYVYLFYFQWSPLIVFILQESFQIEDIEKLYESLFVADDWLQEIHPIDPNLCCYHAPGCDFVYVHLIRTILETNWTTGITKANKLWTHFQKWFWVSRRIKNALVPLWPIHDFWFFIFRVVESVDGRISSTWIISYFRTKNAYVCRASSLILRFFSVHGLDMVSGQRYAATRRFSSNPYHLFLQVLLMFYETRI